MADILKVKRGKHTTIAELNPVLEDGEVVFEKKDDGTTGYGLIKMGDGNTPYNDLPPFVSGVGGVDIRDDDPPAEDMFPGKMWIVRGE